MANRLTFFEKLTLPSIASQSDSDFKFLILTGEGLPDLHRSRLERLVSGINNVQILVEPEWQDHTALCSRLLLFQRDEGRRYFGEFRLDDDDAVAIDFIEMSRHFFLGISGALRKSGAIELDFTHGVVLDFSFNNIRARKTVSTHWTPAQVFVFGARSRLSMFNFHHQRFWKDHLCLSIPREGMFIRSIHGGNDSAPKIDSTQRDVGDSELVSRFNVRIGELRASWGGGPCE